MSGLNVKPMSYIMFGGTCGFIGSAVDSLLVRRAVVHIVSLLLYLPKSILLSMSQYVYQGGNYASDILRQREEMYPLLQQQSRGSIIQHRSHLWEKYSDKCTSKHCQYIVYIGNWIQVRVHLLLNAAAFRRLLTT